MHSEQNRTDEARPGARLARPASLTRATLLLAGLATCAIAIAGGGYILLRNLPNSCLANTKPDNPIIEGSQLSGPIPFDKWGQPELVLVLSGQTMGYLGPCGCSEPQHGGLVRRQALIDSLRAKGWDVVGVDLGEIAPKPNTGIRKQQLLKLQYTMKALDQMGYRAVGLGKNEMAMPLIDALSAYSIEHANPRPIASTLDGTEDKKQIYHGLNVRPYEIFGGDKTPRVGVLSLTGPDLEDSFKNDKAMHFLNNKSVVLPKVWKAFASEKVDLAVLLHHEYPADETNPVKIDDAREKMAALCAKAWEAERKTNSKIPPLQIMMILTEESLAPMFMKPIPGTPTQLIEVGHKGTYVGVVGIFRKGDGVTLKYELVKMDPSWQPKEGQANKAQKVLDEYAQAVKRDDLLADHIRSPHPMQVDNYVQKKYGGTGFVGSDRCSGCHEAAYAIWGKTKHAGAFQTLEKAETNLRHFDPECVICHTVGFKHPEGYNDLPRFKWQELQQQKAGPAAIKAALAKHNAKMRDVGCESCHGPGSAHSNNPDDLKLRELMNPFRPTGDEVKAAVADPKKAKQLFENRMNRLDDFCMKCHDGENDVHWSQEPFLRKWTHAAKDWGPIIHNSPNNVGNRWLPAANPAKKEK